MRNILVIVGSGTKKGNTSQLADAFCKGATKAGHLSSRSLTIVLLQKQLTVRILGCV